MKTIEEIVTEITEQAQTAFELQCSGSNWHSLVLTSEGNVYWAEEFDCHSCSEAVWKGEDIVLMKFQGWTPDEDQAYYEQIEATADEIAKIKAEIAEYEDPEDAPEEIQIGDEIYHTGDKYYRFDPDTWYRNGDLVTDVPEMWPSMDDAIKTAEEYWNTRNES